MQNGGRRPGAGRKPGGKNRIKVELETAAQRVQKCVDGGLTPLEYMLAVMRDATLAHPVRFAAAAEAASYIHAKMQNLDVNVTGLPQLVTIVVPPL